MIPDTNLAPPVVMEHTIMYTTDNLVQVCILVR